jgi:Lipocalin-like domain
MKPVTITLSAAVLALASLAGHLGQATDQPKTLQDQVIGTWAYVSVDIVRPDGSRLPLFGPHPSGLAIFDRSGHYLLLTARSELPKFASNNRATGTDAENRAVVEGSIAHFGTYAVNEADKTITFAITTSTFPNWNGARQKRPITLTADELKWTTAASSGGTAEVVLKRVR